MEVNKPHLMIEIWENKLMFNNDNEDSQNLMDINNDLENIQLNLTQQLILKNDCNRTRVKERENFEDFMIWLERLITYYCTINNIDYKQGLNEIAGVFLLLKTKVKMDWAKVLNLFSLFMAKFLTNYYHETKFIALKSSLSLISVLLQYHSPAIQNAFDKACVMAEMYATSWVLTLFAGKLELEILIYLWNLIIIDDDYLITHFLIIAFLIHNKDKILFIDPSQVPMVISSLTMDDKKDVKNIFNLAISLRDNTPYSFRMLADYLGIFNRNRLPHLRALNNIFIPDKLMSLPIFPSEVLYITFRQYLDCPDENCPVFKKNIKKLLNSGNLDIIPTNINYSKVSSFQEKKSSEKIKNKKIKNQLNDSVFMKLDNLDINFNSKYCYFCKRMPFSHHSIEYALLDLRNKDQNSDIGILPKTLIIEKSDISQENFPDKLLENFIGEKNKIQIILITSKTSYFEDFEEKFYCVQNFKSRSKSQFLSSVSTKILKIEELKKLNTEEEFKLKEYDNLKKSVKILTNNNFAYISFAFGGFYNIHNKAIKLQIPLMNHDKCSICVKNNRKENIFDKILNWTTRKIINKENNVVTSEFSVLSPSSKIYYSTEEINELIDTTLINVFNCTLVDFNTHNLEKRLISNEGYKEVILIAGLIELKLFYLEKYERENKGELRFVLIEKILISNIIDIKSKKNIITIKYKSITHIYKIILDMDTKTFDMMMKSNSELQKHLK